MFKKMVIATTAIIVAVAALTGCSGADYTPVSVTVNNAIYVGPVGDAPASCMVTFTREDGTTGLARTIYATDCFLIKTGDIMNFNGIYVTTY